MTRWALIVDVERCVNCNNCLLATKDEHIGNDFPGYAAPQPKLGHSWIAIQRHIRGDGPMVDSTYMPVMCNHCDNAPCIKAAKDGCIYKRDDGIVIIDPVRAKGRRDLMRSCPYHAMSWNEELEVPQIWIFDAHLLDQGWRKPRCEQVCPTKAITAVRADDARLQEIVAAKELQVRHPEYRTQPRVYYRNLHRITTCFIGGNVVTVSEGRQINVADANVTLRHKGEVTTECRTNAFGDFKFDRLANDSGEYSLEIDHPDHGRAIIAVRLGESTFVGTTVLSR